jgi:hypothetical protein
MATVAAPQREKYVPSGRVFWPLFLLSLGALAVLTLILGALLGISVHLLYMVIASPALAGVALGGAAMLLLRASHCRSPLLAAFTVGALGAVLYLWQFPAEFTYQVGPVALLHPESWPSYVLMQVNNWQIGDPGQANQGNPWPVFNWILFTVELIITAAVAGGLAAAGTVGGYCEKCRKWMSKRMAVVGPNCATAVVEHLNAGTFEKLPDLPANAVPGAHALLEVEGCSHGGYDAAATFYLSAREVRGQGDSIKTTSLVQQVLLTPDEFLLLVERCPALAGKT